MVQCFFAIPNAESNCWFVTMSSLIRSQSIHQYGPLQVWRSPGLVFPERRKEWRSWGSIRHDEVSRNSSHSNSVTHLKNITQLFAIFHSKSHAALPARECILASLKGILPLGTSKIAKQLAWCSWGESHCDCGSSSTNFIIRIDPQGRQLFSSLREHQTWRPSYLQWTILMNALRPMQRTLVRTSIRSAWVSRRRHEPLLQHDKSFGSLLYCYGYVFSWLLTSLRLLTFKIVLTSAAQTCLFQVS